MTDPSGFASLARGGGPNRRTAHEFVTDAIRQAILNGEIAPGTRLVQAELAEMLGVSTTPVREALRDLAAEDLVILDAHRGGMVKELSDRELVEIYDLRRLLEIAALRRALPKLTPSDIDRLEQLCDEMRAATNASEFVPLNREFHLTIYRAAGSPRLLHMLQGLMNASVMYLSTSLHADSSLRRTAESDHAQILDAVRSGDVEAAVAATERHLDLPRRALHASS